MEFQRKFLETNEVSDESLLVPVLAHLCSRFVGLFFEASIYEPLRCVQSQLNLIFKQSFCYELKLLKFFLKCEPQ